VSGLSDTLLAPRSVALVGASDDPAKTASRPLRYLRAGGFQGAIYPVARRAVVGGERAWPSLSDLPERPDHAFILLPTEGAVEAVAECVRLGIPAVTVLAGGFAEAGADGAALQERMLATLQEGSTRLLGPSSLGLVNLHRHTVLTANAAFAEPELPLGGLFVVSQSGSMIGAMASRGKGRGIGFAFLVSVGGEADLGVGEVCMAALDDPDVTAFLLFLETIRDAPDICRFALGAAERGKPVVAYKLGRSREAAELAQSHTGALAGEDDVADAFLRDCGIARVTNFEALLEAPPLLRRMAVRPAGARRPRIGIVTTTGGGAAMVVEGLGLRGIEVVGPADATAARLRAAGIDPGNGRILDLTLAGTRYDVMKPALDAMRSDPDYDVVVAVVGSSARFQPELAVRPILDSDATAGAPLAAFLVPDAPDALRSLAAADIPAFRTPEACADAIAAAIGRRVPVIRPEPRPAARLRRLIDELDAYALLAEIGIPSAPCAELADAAAIRFPAAVKILSSEIAHKSDCGGVVLGVTDPAGVAAAAVLVRRRAAAAHPGLRDARVLVQQMAAGVGEALIGYRVDPQVGPIVLLAAGGVTTEIYADRSVRTAPIDLTGAHAMIDEVAGFALLRGFRGRPLGDLGALAAAVVAMSRLALHPAVVECEINPLIVMEKSVVAVDAVASMDTET